MSVAEALGREPQGPIALDARRQKYYPGLNLGVFGIPENDASPRYNLSVSDMFGTNQVPRDFRLKGYTSQNMFSPRQPVIAPSPDDRRKNEEQLLKYFGKSSIFDPAKPRIDEGHSGMQYGDRNYDRGHPHPRPITDPFVEKTDNDMDKIRKQRMDMDEDIQRMKERQMKEKMQREEEKKQNYDMLTKTFPWDQRSQGHGGPRYDYDDYTWHEQMDLDNGPIWKSERPEYQISRKRETDLFLDTLGGPGGTVLRQNGSPTLTDSRFQQQQSQFQQFQTQSPHPGGMTPKELQEYSKKLEQVSEEKKMMKQQRRIEDLRKQIDTMKQSNGIDNDFDNYSNRGDDYMRPNQRRSLDLDNSKGGAGAPIKDPRGKNVTRFPITLSRDDYGESKIKEDIPGKATFDLNFMEEENKPYYPWGGQGGGAPIRDRDGNVRTQIYGKLEGKAGPDAEIRRHRRRQEMLYNELKEGARQHKENKEELTRYMKAPQAELAEVLMAGRVGKPKRDEITGEIGQQHLPNSDVSLVKMNHQPKPITEKRKYHDELIRMAEERQHQKQLEKLKEKQESNAHFQYMDSTWGAFGGGAPKHQSIRKKANLTNSLFYPEASPGDYQAMGDDYLPPTGLGSFEFQSPNPACQKLYVAEDSRRYHSPDNTPRFTKSTINSSHKNMFETSSEQRYERGGPRETLPPYATGGIF